jgi:hypothetical protein
MLSKFIRSVPADNVDVGLFYHPKSPILKRIARIPPLLEALGVHHIKAAVFDDDVILTG